MDINHDIAPFVVHEEASIGRALEQISGNAAGVVYVVTGNGRVVGVMTDGDFRRWVLRQTSVDISAPVTDVANPRFEWASSEDPTKEVGAKFSARIRSVPLLDRYGRLTAIAWPRSGALTIGSRKVGEGQPVFVIAEIGNNHNGDPDLAKRLVDLAVEAGADAVKFQMRHLDTIYGDRRVRRGAGHDLHSEYTLDLLERFQLPPAEILRLLEYTAGLGVTALCTPWDLPSLDLLQEANVPAFKIASADLTNYPLLEAAAATTRPILLSTGMSEESEIRQAVRLLGDLNAPFALLHCVSTYPAAPETINLRYMDRLREIGSCPVGYSGHELGTSISIAAVALGADIIERHLTRDRTMEGNDHRASLLPQEFANMVEGIRLAEAARGGGGRRALGQGERLNRENLAKSLIAIEPIAKGTPITRDLLVTRSPGRGVQPNRLLDILGKTAGRDIPAGDFIYHSDVFDEGSAEPREFRFDRPWGLPVRYHDWRSLTARSNPELLEFHLSYRDLELDPRESLGDGDLGEYRIVVHAPELFVGDHLLDLSTEDEAYAHRSMSEMQRVLDVACLLGRISGREEPVSVVVNVGGSSTRHPVDAEERAAMYGRVATRLGKIVRPEVEFLIQTMPPFPWHFGGRRRHNLFVDPQQIASYCQANGARICLDWSHSQLAASHLGHDLPRYFEAVAPFVAHMHVADAEGLDGEGLQIGEGEVDFEAAARALAKDAPDASFIPEVWQGHKNEGEGFWRALDSLEGIL